MTNLLVFVIKVKHCQEAHVLLLRTELSYTFEARRQKVMGFSERRTEDTQQLGAPLPRPLPNHRMSSRQPSLIA